MLLRPRKHEASWDTVGPAADAAAMAAAAAAAAAGADSAAVLWGAQRGCGLASG